MNLSLLFGLVLINSVWCLPNQYYQHSAAAKRQNQMRILNQESSKNDTLQQDYYYPYYSHELRSNYLTHRPFNFPLPFSIPAPAAPVIGPYPIQQQTITSTGEIITESLIGGLPFNCFGKATGHYRDSFFCDVFHACVYGDQRKTYSCPFVGELVYFDDYTRRCEFIRNNPAGCPTNSFLNLF